MICVSTGSRIHFGLSMVPATPGTQSNVVGTTSLSPWRYGGIGVMVETPGIILQARPEEMWSAEGPLANRALGFAEGLAAALSPPDIQPLHFTVEKAPPEHCGFGTGTQLACAVARAISEVSNISEVSMMALARLVGRGARTAVGIAGFELGGLLLDRGSSSNASDTSGVLRLDFPEAWRLVVFIPPMGLGLHGEQETKAFDQLERATVAQSSDRAATITPRSGFSAALEETWRAAADANFHGFCRALHDFNTQVGSIFASMQGGTYAHPMTTEMIEFLCNRGICGVGQSSWGPAGFAIAENDESGREIALSLRRRFNLDDAAVTLTSAKNQGAQISIC
jgi:beta-ribofuranosylaminobenzene 5'-phosphate synthase